MARIGFVSAASLGPNEARIHALRLGLRELGYVEGKNIAIDYRWADEKLDRLPVLVAELVRLNVDVLVTSGPTATRAAKQGTNMIPIVMTFDLDPVANGFVASLARPGGNITGLSAQAPELSGKQLELLKEIVPKLSRVAIIGSSAMPSNEQMLKELVFAARALNIQLQSVDVLNANHVESAFRSAIKGRAEAIVVLHSQVIGSHRKTIAELAVNSRLPAIYPWSEFVEDGGLISYSTSFPDLSRRAASYIVKILNGAKPAVIPVEQPTKLELVINLKAAEQIGLVVPPSVLTRADRVLQ
jgi:putative ABC transport system substrate-binding protein